ncbi:MAG: hypothetical protein LWW93_10010 [Hyphomicrobiales bacterium]|nr:hypothetical protein [Hyphomicrobiales bacterium]
MSRRAYASLAAALLLFGCSKLPDVDQRYGPGPTIAVADVETKLARQAAVMDTLAGFAKKRDASLTGAPLWWEATQLGFNYVDEECAEYLRLNFRFTRMRQRDSDILDLLSKNASGLLAAARVADPTITTVAAAFGVGAQLTEKWLDSYLFKMEPELVFRTVTKLQVAYRTEIERKRSEIASAGVGYRVVQNYYTLCFPQTIEAKMSEFIALSTPDTGAATPSVAARAGASTTPVTAVDPKLTSTR